MKHPSILNTFTPELFFTLTASPDTENRYTFTISTPENEKNGKNLIIVALSEDNCSNFFKKQQIQYSELINSRISETLAVWNTLFFVLFCACAAFILRSYAPAAAHAVLHGTLVSWIFICPLFFLSAPSVYIFSFFSLILSLFFLFYSIKHISLHIRQTLPSKLRLNAVIICLFCYFFPVYFTVSFEINKKHAESDKSSVLQHVSDYLNTESPFLYKKTYVLNSAATHYTAEIPVMENAFICAFVIGKSGCSNLFYLNRPQIKKNVPLSSDPVKISAEFSVPRHAKSGDIIYPALLIESFEEDSFEAHIMLSENSFFESLSPLNISKTIFGGVNPPVLFKTRITGSGLCHFHFTVNGQKLYREIIIKKPDILHTDSAEITISVSFPGTMGHKEKATAQISVATPFIASPCSLIVDIPTGFSADSEYLARYMKIFYPDSFDSIDKNAFQLCLNLKNVPKQMRLKLLLINDYSVTTEFAPVILLKERKIIGISRPRKIRVIENTDIYDLIGINAL